MQQFPQLLATWFPREHAQSKAACIMLLRGPGNEKATAAAKRVKVPTRVGINRLIDGKINRF
jgi:hypothetical protein